MRATAQCNERAMTTTNAPVFGVGGRALRHDRPVSRRRALGKIPSRIGNRMGKNHMIGAVILGIVAGYVGRLLMPGRDAMGFIATVLLGIAGAVVGFLVFTELLGIGDDSMFDLGGLIGAVIGVMILLALYRVALKDKEHPLAR
jgi:uncharacterized membrane protein YeaQ/YmgE (transglycosylase-associated protein family)